MYRLTFTKSEFASATEWTATVLIPILRAVRMIRQAISPRFAIRIFPTRGKKYYVLVSYYNIAQSKTCKTSYRMWARWSRLGLECKSPPMVLVCAKQCAWCSSIWQLRWQRVTAVAHAADIFWWLWQPASGGHPCFPMQRVVSSVLNEGQSLRGLRGLFGFLFTSKKVQRKNQ